MSKPFSVSNTAPGVAEKQASAAQPAKQGRWGWPLRSSFDGSKSSSSPSGAGSGSSAPTPPLPVIPGVDNSQSSSQPDTAVPKSSAVLSSSQPTEANSAKLPSIPDRDTEQASGDAKAPRTSISSERPPQTQLPISPPNSAGFDNDVDAPNSVDTRNSPNTQQAPPVIDLKSPKRTWPPVQTRKKSQDSTNKEDAPFSSSRKSSASTLSTRRSSRNLPTWPPVSTLSGDARDVEPNGAPGPPSLRKSIGPGDNKQPTQEIRERASADQAPLPSSPVKSDRISDEANGEVGEHDPHTARVPEAIQTPHEKAGQRPLSHIPGSFPTRSSSTVGALVNEEAESVSGPPDSSSLLSSVPAIPEITRVDDRDSEEKTPTLRSDVSGLRETAPRASSYEMEQNPWDHESILQTGDARNIPAESKTVNGFGLDPSFLEREAGPGHSETPIPSAARKDSDLNVKDSEPRAFENHKNGKKVRFAGFDRNSGSSGSITPTKQVPNRIKEHSPSTVSQVENEDKTSFGNSFTHDRLSPFPGHETNREGLLAGSTTAPQSDISSEDLSSLQGVKSKEPSGASSPADVSVTKGEAPSAEPVNLETSLPESTPRFCGTDQKEKLPQPNSKRTSGEDEGSFNRAGGEGKLLDLTIGVQAAVRPGENRNPSNEISELETVRTVVEIPPSHNTDNRLPIPKIYIQNPTDGTEPETYAPRSSQSATRGAVRRRSTFPGKPPAFIDSKAAEDPGTSEEPKMPPPKKRKLYLRKVRNAAARKTILKITLGRELAKQTKAKLRKLAKGGHFDFE